MKKKYRIALHVLVWLVLYLNDFLPKYLDKAFSSYDGVDAGPGLLLNYALISLGYLVSSLVVFYTTAFLIAPAFLKKQWLKGILSLLLLILFIPGYRYLLEFRVLIPYLHFDNYFGKTPETYWYIKNSILFSFYSYFIYALIYFVASEWYNNKGKQKELEKEKISAELAFLKSQINPHFLFNTMNDIYALTYQRSELAPRAVLKLSALLRYMLQESEEKFAALEKEIEYIKNVIELQQIGQKGNAFVDFQIKGNAGEQQIAPLILINFVENAFKHGVIDEVNTPVKVEMIIDQLELFFMVSNVKNQDQKDARGGIGLNNVKRRLELIYPGKHQLDVLEDKDTFTIKLKIEWT
eukprot:gene11785-13745_t